MCVRPPLREGTQRFVSSPFVAMPPLPDSWSASALRTRATKKEFSLACLALQPLTPLASVITADLYLWHFVGSRNTLSATHRSG